MNVTKTIKQKLPRAMQKSMLYEDGETIMRAWASGQTEGVRVPRIVEIGTYWGVSACILSDYGHVDTFDLVSDSTANKVDRALELEPGRVRRHSGGGKQEALDTDLRTCVTQDGPFDIGHIDGDHSYEAVAHDFELLVEAGCKAILIHDYGKLPPEGRGQAGVNDFVTQLPEDCWEDIEPFAAVDVVKFQELAAHGVLGEFAPDNEIEAPTVVKDDEGNQEDTGV